MLVASDISGFGAYTGGSAADCKSGWGYLCGPRGGIQSCRPCDYSQLEAMKALQREANKLVVAYGLDSRPAVVTGSRSCTGGYTLAIDGRIGPCTQRTMAAIAQRAKIAFPYSVASIESIAKYTPELLEHTKRLAALAGAKKDVPAPPSQPIARTDAPGSVPGAKPAPGAITTAMPKPKMARAGVFVGVLGFLAATGLIAAGAYYGRQ
jgi:hypothetical protein